MRLGSEIDNVLYGVVDKLFSRAELDRDGSEEANAGDVFDTGLWKKVGEMGLASLLTPDSRGGSDGGWVEAFTLHHAAAFRAVPLPLVEHDVLGSWLAEQANLPADERRITVAFPRPTTGEYDVPWGRNAERILTLVPSAGATRKVLDVDPSGSLALQRGVDLAGQPRDRMRLSGADLQARDAVEVSAAVVDGLRLRGALARSIQLSGVLDRCIELAVEYAGVRHQFGRPLVAFQAVQAHLADAASEAALARAANRAAVRVVVANGGDVSAAVVPVAVAKSITSHAAGRVTRSAHQVIGAIGTTEEHDLHRFTTRALVWRDDHGTATYWDRVLGAHSRAHGAAALWSNIVDEASV